jgi:hypothetical protein
LIKEDKIMRGRKPFGPEFVHHVEGTAEAKKRAQVLLETLTGRLSVQEASERLGICPQRLDQLRLQMVSAAVHSLEPGHAGRPRRVPDPAAVPMAALAERIRDLEIELRAGQIREEIALQIPHLLHPQDDAEKKSAGGAKCPGYSRAAART